MGSASRRTFSAWLGATLLTATSIVVTIASPGLFASASSSDFDLARITDVGTVPANGPSTEADISDNASTVAFITTAASLIGESVGFNQQVVAFDRDAGMHRLVSEAVTGGASGGFSWSPDVSADGRYVAFASDAPDLVADDTNGRGDVFVHDLVTGTTTRVSADDGIYTSYLDPQLSDDGATLVVGGSAPGILDLLVAEWQTEPLSKIAAAPVGAAARFAFSGDGSTIGFAGEHAGGPAIGFFDLATSTVTDFLVGESGADLTIDDDGDTLAYVFGQPFDEQFLKLLTRGASSPAVIVERSFDSTEIRHPDLSGDGSTLVWDEFIEDCDTSTGECFSSGSVYDYDLLTGATLTVSLPCDDCFESAASGLATTDETGAFIAFESTSDDLIEVPDINAASDVFVANRLANDRPEFPAGSEVRLVAAGATFLDVEWDEATDDVAVTGYEVFVDDVSVGTTVAADRTFLVDGLAPLTAYTVEIQAFDAADRRSDRIGTTATTTAAATAALVVDGVTATTADLLWDPADPVGLEGYRILRSVEGGSFDEVADVDAGTTTLTDTDLIPESSIEWRVDAIRTGVAGPHTTTAAAITPPVTIDDLQVNVPTVANTDVAVLGETLRLVVSAAPGLSGSADITYRSWFDAVGAEQPVPVDRSATIAIVQDPFGLPGRYVGDFPLVEGVTGIDDISVRLEHPGGSADTAAATGVPGETTAGLVIEVDAPADSLQGGPSGDSWELVVDGTTRPSQRLDVFGGTTEMVSGFLAGETATVELVTWWARIETSLTDVALVPGLFSELTIAPRAVGDVTVEVLDGDGAPVGGATVTYFDAATGDEIGSQVTLNANGRPPLGFEQVLVGDVVRAEVTRDDIVDVSTTFTVTGPDQLVSVSTVPVLRGTVRGQLLDDGGTPTIGSVTLLQNGGRTDVATDADGRFELAAEPGPALLSGRAGSEAPTPTIAIEVPEPPAAAEVELRTRGQREYEVLVDVFIDEPDGTTTGPEVSESYPDLLLRQVGNPFGAVPFRAVNRYTTTAVRGAPFDVCLSSRVRGLGEVCETVTPGDDPTISVELRLAPAAVVTGTFVDDAGVPVTAGLWFASAARVGDFGTTLPTRRGSLGRDPLSLYLPEAGPWNVTLSWSDPTDGRNTFVAAFPVTVSSGQVLDLGTIAPLSAGRFTRPGNSVVTSPTEVLPGHVVEIRASYANAFVETTDAELAIPLPDSTTFLPDGTTRDATATPSRLDGDVVIVPLGDLAPGEIGTVRVRLLVDEGAAVTGTPVRVLMRHRDAAAEGDLVAIGSYRVAGVTLLAPARTASPAIRLAGRAPVGSTVSVTDAGVLIGEAVTSAGGRWELDVDLPQLPDPFEHRLEAITTVDGRVLRSDIAWVDIDPAWPEPARVTMTQRFTQTWEPTRGVVSFPFAYIVPEAGSDLRNVAFPANPLVVDVEFDDPDLVRWLAVTIGDTTEFATLVDGIWTASLIPRELGDVSITYDAARRTVEPTEIVALDDGELEQLVPGVAGVRVGDVSGNDRGGTARFEVPVGDGGIGVRVDADLDVGVDFSPTVSQLELATRAGLPVYVDTVDIAESSDAATLDVRVLVDTAFLEEAATAALDPDTPFDLSSSATGSGEFTEVDLTLNLQDLAVAAGGVFSDKLSIFGALTTGSKYDTLEALRAAAECPELSLAEFNAFNARIELLENFAAYMDVTAVVTTITGVLFTVFATPLAGAAVGATSALLQAAQAAKFDVDTKVLKQELIDAGCTCPDAPSATPRWIYDPSGYVYEGVASNRVEGATATVYEGVTETGPFAAWDAQPYAQENPLLTDADGKYAWDVPEGWWQVRYEKDGYLPAESAVLRVLPPRFDVNVGLVPVAAPTVTSVDASDGPPSIEVTFSTYMDPATVDISASVGGVDLDGTVVAVDAEPDPDGRSLARVFRLLPATPIVEGDEVDVVVDGNAEDFTGRRVGGSVSRSVVVEAGQRVEVQGTVFFDADENTFLDDGEAGVPDVGVTVVDSFGAVAEVVTDGGGTWSAEVAPGPVEVTVDDLAAPLEGFVPTSSIEQVVSVTGDDAVAVARPVGFAAAETDGTGPQCTVSGTEGRDVLFGTSGDDVICGFGGRDIIFAFGGDDLVLAGDGDDFVLAGGGNDTVSGGPGSDLLLGGSGADMLDGGDGNDRLFGQGGADTLLGGPGSDVLIGGSGRDELDGGAGADWCGFSWRDRRTSCP